MHPYAIREAEDFLNESARIQEYYNIQKDSVKKWGPPGSLCELNASIKKCIEDKRYRTAYLNKLLKTEHRSFKLGCLLPAKVSDYPNFNLILKKELKQTISDGFLFNGHFNEALGKKAFPSLFISCLKTSIDEICIKIEKTG